MGEVVFIVLWYPAKYEDSILMGAWYDAELAQGYIAGREHPTQYTIQKLNLEDSDGSS